MIATTLSHLPVLLDESIAALRLDGDPIVGDPIVGDPVVVDGTFGGGGHSLAILERHPTARVVGIDRDEAAIERGAALAASIGPDRLAMVHGSFADLPALLGGAGVGPVDGVLLDLGLSSYQLDDPERGFAFRLDGPLDMRFDPGAGLSAADLVADLDERALADLIYRNGDERRSRQIAAAIVRTREREPITSTAQLAALVETAVGGRRGAPTHPATQTFLALRIVVNDELGALATGLDGAVASLRPGGRLAVISFHSIEDRLVKLAFRRLAATCVCPPQQPICTCDTVPAIRVVGKSIRPSDEESRANPRSRSATLRVAERLTDEGERREPATDTSA